MQLNSLVLVFGFCHQRNGAESISAQPCSSRPLRFPSSPIDSTTNLQFKLTIQCNGLVIIRPYNKDSQTTRATKMMKISLFTLLLIIAQGVVSGTPIPPNPNLKTLVSRSPHSDGDVGGDPGDQGGNSAGNPLCPDCG
ncbi:hypothetical protein Pst134EA_028926 [Puccinia striiformis f. sp. tritici]|uniref:hypothetical protein n=1 Tax=Puccinia striiformis f. sp. tritici TaxID=168172 RepID=UPI002008978F|nr:hypothetical protein Pst134EA_028926 [Puccinia striiformis f. sp. tritici]KAH9446941.1 hypothetical protein Pst134EA_028926 [Puccinia striiformis f. sp. tritici]